jgi:AraC-like DNA-binding protein
MRVPDPCVTFRFSTAGVSEPERAEAVRDLHLRERHLLPAGFEPLEPLEPLSNRPPQVDVIKRTLPGLALVSGTFSGLRHAARPKGAAGHGENDLLFCVNVRGRSVALQRDRELVLRDGDAFFATRSSAGFNIVRPTPARFIGCRVPRETVAALLGRLDDTPMSFVPHDTEALSLLITYASAIADALPLATPELQRLTVSHMQDLIAASIATTRGGRAIAEGRGIAAARLRAIMMDIDAHIGDGDLSVNKVADRHRITPRYLHKLFESEGLTFSSFVLGQAPLPRTPNVERFEPCRSEHQHDRVRCGFWRPFIFQSCLPTVLRCYTQGGQAVVRERRHTDTCSPTPNVDQMRSGRTQPLTSAAGSRTGVGSTQSVRLKHLR